MSELKSLTHEQLRKRVKDAPALLVDEMLQVCTVNVLVGDSGIGKSPLLMQLGICIALGIPFLGLKTRQARVLYVDFENSAIDLNDTLENLSLFIKQPIPEDFRVLHFPADNNAILTEIINFKPELIIIDALRGYNAKAEKDPDVMNTMLQSLHKQANQYKCSFLFLHHIRKKDLKEPPDPLSDMSVPTLDWLLQASGTRALINQTEARFGIEGYTTGDASLIMRGHFKLKGEVGAWKIKRVFGDEEAALGYERIIGFDLLTQPQRDRYIKLPDDFSWSEAAEMLALKAGKTLLQFISACRAAGLIYKTGQRKDARYHKTSLGLAEQEAMLSLLHK